MAIKNKLEILLGQQSGTHGSQATCKSNQNLQVNINGTELEFVSKIKLLGVLLDNSLYRKEQVQAVSLKVSRELGILKHAEKFLPFSALTSL